MSALRWLEAGATGSYGTVVEPCNYVTKFPRPDILLNYYLQGETLIEAYWKSVAWPSEGLFIGEPLAAPYSLRWSDKSDIEENTESPKSSISLQIPSAVDFPPTGN